MNTSTNPRRIGGCLLAVSALCAALPAQAATINLDLSGSPTQGWHSDSSPYTGASGPMIACSPCRVDVLDLTVAGSGAGQSAATDLALGDTVHGVLQLNQPLNLGPSAAGLSMVLSLFSLPFAPNGTDVYTVFYGSAGGSPFSMSLGGVPVSLPGWQSFGGSGGGALVFGGLSSHTQANFSVDRISFDGTVQQILDSSGTNYTGLSLAGAPLQLTVFSSPVPEPATGLLWLLAGVAALLGRRALQTSSHSPRSWCSSVPTR